MAREYLFTCDGYPLYHASDASRITRLFDQDPHSVTRTVEQHGSPLDLALLAASTGLSTRTLNQLSQISSPDYPPVIFGSEANRYDPSIPNHPPSRPPSSDIDLLLSPNLRPHIQKLFPNGNWVVSGASPHALELYVTTTATNRQLECHFFNHPMHPVCLALAAAPDYLNTQSVVFLKTGPVFWDPYQVGHYFDPDEDWRIPVPNKYVELNSPAIMAGRGLVAAVMKAMRMPQGAFYKYALFEPSTEAIKTIASNYKDFELTPGTARSLHAHIFKELNRFQPASSCCDHLKNLGGLGLFPFVWQATETLRSMALVDALCYLLHRTIEHNYLPDASLQLQELFALYPGNGYYVDPQAAITTLTILAAKPPAWFKSIPINPSYSFRELERNQRFLDTISMHINPKTTNDHRELRHHPWPEQVSTLADQLFTPPVDAAASSIY